MKQICFHEKKKLIQKWELLLPIFRKKNEEENKSKTLSEENQKNI
jgi:hypothetical protein